MKIKKFTEKSITFKLIKKTEELKRSLSFELEEYGLNFYQALIIVSLYIEKRKLKPSDFVEMFHIPKSVVSQCLSSLEEKEFVRREICEDDSRVKWISLSFQAKRKAPKIMSMIEKVDNQLDQEVSLELY